MDDGQLPFTREVIALEAGHEESSRDELEQLRRTLAEVSASRARLVRAADAERQSIERELHAGVQQDLAALAVGIELAAQAVETDPGAAQTQLEDVRRDVQRAIENAARLAARISPPQLEAGGLTVALRSAFASAGVPVSLDVAAATRCPAEIVVTVYVCCLGVLAGATPGARANVTLRDEHDAAAFEIRVDGGSPDGELDHLRDRVEALGGSLAIASGPDGRIQLSGSLPVAR